jgi:antitoxin component YwqK of YwqJK toxin-antitoxin module
MFSDMWIKKTQNIIETFDDGSPKLLHITKNILGNSYLTRTIEFWDNGEVRYDKQFKNGKPEGKQLFFSEHGNKTEQWIKNGKRDGFYSQWDKSGDLIIKEKWKNGKRLKIILNLQKG